MKEKIAGMNCISRLIPIGTHKGRIKKDAEEIFIGCRGNCSFLKGKWEIGFEVAFIGCFADNPDISGRMAKSGETGCILFLFLLYYRFLSLLLFLV